MSEPLDRDRLASPDGPWRVLVFRETASTNDVVRRAAEGGEREGFVAFAEAQTHGRGQFGRVWDSRPGLGLWFSILLRPQWNAADFPQMTPLIAVAVARALRKAAGLKVRIKPPNDIYVGAKKLAGILSEARAGRDAFVVVGIGVNVLHAVADFPLELQGSATSVALQQVHGSPDREVLGAAILAEVGLVYRVNMPPDAALLAEYAALSSGGDCDTVAA